VLVAARRLGYRSNALARALKQFRSGALALIVPMARNPIWSVLDRGRPWPDLAVPHVYLNRRGPRPGHDVVMDEEGAVALWLAEMGRRGRRDLVLVDGPDRVDTVHRRTMAARASTRRDGSPAVRVVHADATEQGGWSAACRLLTGPDRPDGIGVGSLPQLTGVVAALRAHASATSDEVSLVSFDEDDSLSCLGIPVTSIAIAPGRAGRRRRRLRAGPGDWRTGPRRPGRRPDAPGPARGDQPARLNRAGGTTRAGPRRQPGPRG